MAITKTGIDSNESVNGTQRRASAKSELAPHQGKQQESHIPATSADFTIFTPLLFAAVAASTDHISGEYVRTAVRGLGSEPGAMEYGVRDGGEESGENERLNGGTHARRVSNLTQPGPLSTHSPSDGWPVDG